MTKVVVTPEDANAIERQTIDQANNDQWITERQKRITASIAGGIAKMRATTKHSSKVQQLLYSSFRGNMATCYGSEREHVIRQQYMTDLKGNGHPNLSVQLCGLFVSLQTPWLAGTPDGLVSDPDSSPSLGLMEIKNPYSVRHLTLEEAARSTSFCLQLNKIEKTYKLGHKYYYQNFNCTNRHWCDFVLGAEQFLHVERIDRDTKWLTSNMDKLRTF